MSRNRQCWGKDLSFSAAEHVQDLAHRSYIVENIDDCFAYLETLKYVYKDKVKVYSEFMGVLQAYKQKRIGVPELVVKVVLLLKDRPDMILGFNTFLPEGYKVNIPKKPADERQVLAFLRKIKARDENLHRRFWDIILNFDKGNQYLGDGDVPNEVVDLWKNYPDLMLEFVYFLRENSIEWFTSQVRMKMAQVERPQMGDMKREFIEIKHSPKKSNHRSSQLHPPSPAKSKGKTCENQLEIGKSEHRQLVSAQNLAEGNRQAFIERKGKIVETCDESIGGCEQGRRAAVPIINVLRRKLDFLRLVESNLCEKKKFEGYLKSLAMCSEGLLTVDDFKMLVGADMCLESPELIGESEDLVRQCEVAELELLLPGRPGNLSHERRKRALSQQAEEGEMETNNQQRKKNKRQCLEANFEREKEIINRPLPNLKPSCTMDLEKDCERKRIPHHKSPCTMNLEQNRHSSKENLHKSSNVTSSKSEERENCKRHSSKTNLNNKSSHATGDKSVQQCNNNGHSSKENPRDKPCHATSSKSVEQDTSMRHPFTENPHNRLSHATIGSKYLSKPLSELDFSKCEQCTPSYRLLPDDCPLPSVGSRSVEGCAVLNDKWISATSGREDHTFKCMRKNEYEELLLQCEDDRTDLDILLEYTSSTIRGLEKLLEISSKRGEVVVGNYISAWHQRLIALIYSDCGLEVVECLHQKVGVVTPVILKRVKQKQNEWLKYKAEMNKVWAEIFAKNYQKSLDHSSVYNRQQEMNSLNTKSLLAEIRSLNAENRKSNGFSSSMNYVESMPTIPDVTLECPDGELHADVHTILQRSVKDESRNANKLRGVIHVWKEFLEPMFGVHYDLRKEKETFEHMAEDTGTRIDYSAPYEDGVNQIQHLKAEERENGQIGIISNGNCTDQLMYFKAGEQNEGEIGMTSNGGCFDQLKYFEAEENKESEISPFLPAEGKVSDSDVRLSTMAPAEALLKESSYCSSANKKLENAHGYESKVAESEEHSCRVLPLFTRETSASLIRDSVIFYGNDSMYILLRCYQELYEWMKAVKVQSATKEGSPCEVSQRKLAGNPCLISVDKLIFKLVKQLKVVASDQMAINLLALHTYEQSRALVGIQDSIYHANACGLLHDEGLYRFERKFKTGQLCIKLMEGSLSKQARMHPKFAKSLLKFMLSEPHERPWSNPVFLRRNMLVCSKYGNQMKAFQNTSILNALQLKICCSTYVVSYVLGTEDYFHRRKAKKSLVGHSITEKSLSKAVFKLHRWLDGDK